MWYASRSLFLIENEFQYFNAQIEPPEYMENLKDLKDILTEARSYLKDAFENEATRFLLSSAIKDEKTGFTYFRDFIGLNDTDVFGKPKENDEE
jgi:hypothetical protein